MSTKAMERRIQKIKRIDKMESLIVVCHDLPYFADHGCRYEGDDIENFKSGTDLPSQNNPAKERIMSSCLHIA